MTNLPAEGELQVGGVSLPAGKWVYAGDEGVPVAWITIDAVPQAGAVWAALSKESAGTGLIPIILGHLPGESSRPWDSGEFWDLADPAEADRIDVRQFLEKCWDDKTCGPDADEVDPELAAQLGSFGQQFPGLAPQVEVSLEAGELDRLLAAFRDRRIGLVPAARPADVLPATGWSGAANHFQNSLPIAAVLRSWEERFGARLLELGFADVSVVASRPPRTTEEAQRIGAEHWAFADECGTGLTEIPAITDQLLSSPVWSFWWD
jgi:hypothetical protein